MSIKAVIFDIGGVLAYDVWEHLILSKDNGLATLFKLDAEKSQEAGKALWNEFAYKHINREDGWLELETAYWEKFIREFNLQVSVDELRIQTDKFVKPVEGMMNIINALYDRNIKLAICSNNTEFWYKRQNMKLGIEKIIPKENIILSSKIGVSKGSPNHEMFSAAIESLGTSKASCLFIDDRIENVAHANDFGIASVLFPSHSTVGAKYLRNLFQPLGII